MCPRCGSMRFRFSRSRSTAERMATYVFPIAFHRCHDCSYRSWRFVRNRKALLRYFAPVVACVAILALAAVAVFTVMR